MLGGVSIFGGRGTIVGVILALFLLGGIQKALTLSESLSSYWVQIVTGACWCSRSSSPTSSRALAKRRAEAPAVAARGRRDRGLPTATGGDA